MAIKYVDGDVKNKNNDTVDVSGNNSDDNEKRLHRIKKILTTSSVILSIALMKAQTHFLWVFGSTAPLSDPPMAAHHEPCLGYTFKKLRHHSRCSGRPSSRRCLPWTMSFQTSSTTITLVPKNLRKSSVSINLEPTRRFARFWMSRAMARKSGSPSTASSMMWASLGPSWLLSVMFVAGNTVGEGGGDIIVDVGSYFL